MPTLTLTFDPYLSMPDSATPNVADAAAMLDEVDEHDEWTLAVVPDGATSMVMLSDDERTAWYVLTLPDGGGVQVDTFTLTDGAA